MVGEYAGGLGRMPYCIKGDKKDCYLGGGALGWRVLRAMACGGPSGAARMRHADFSRRALGARLLQANVGWGRSPLLLRDFTAGAGC